MSSNDPPVAKKVADAAPGSPRGGPGAELWHAITERVDKLPRAARVPIRAMLALGVIAVGAWQFVVPETTKLRTLDRMSGLVGIERSFVPADMIKIPAGAFIAGSPATEADAAYRRCVSLGLQIKCDREQFDRETALHTPTPRTVDSFLIDREEVTNAAFLGWLRPRFPGFVVNPVSDMAIGTRAVFDDADPPRPVVLLSTGESSVSSASGLVEEGGRIVVRPGSEQRPVVGASWFAADAFCRQSQKRLPTEVEWEYVARGSARREFPWGSATPRCDQVVFGRGRRPSFDVDGPCAAGFPQLLEPVSVAPFDRTPEGVLNLGGNAAEWVDDLFSPGGTNRVFRGGAWTDPVLWLRSAARSHDKPGRMLRNVGFRCAATLDVTRIER